jgi:hypothetical protein
MGCLDLTGYPALKAWRREMAEGKRTETTFDELWSAACAEMWALEHQEGGVLDLADSYRRDARRIIQEAARGEAA